MVTCIVFVFNPLFYVCYHVGAIKRTYWSLLILSLAKFGSNSTTDANFLLRVILFIYMCLVCVWSSQLFPEYIG